MRLMVSMAKGLSTKDVHPSKDLKTIQVFPIWNSLALSQAYFVLRQSFKYYLGKTNESYGIKNAKMV